MRIRAIVPAFALLTLVACSGENAANDPVSTEAKTSDVTLDVSSTSQTTTSPVSSATPTADGDVTVEVSPSEGLSQGDDVTVKVSGLNPKLGYYAAICSPERPEQSPVPLCTGGRGDATAQAWIKASGGSVTLQEDGSAVATIAATPTGEGIDCHEQECVLKIFGDHTEGFKDVAEVPISFK